MRRGLKELFELIHLEEELIGYARANDLKTVFIVRIKELLFSCCHEPTKKTLNPGPFQHEHALMVLFAEHCYVHMLDDLPLSD